jgi:very-short-patch-repair endonuclease
MDELPWPFIGSRALAEKAIPERAMRKWYQPVYPDVYVPRGVEPTATQRARAAWLWSGGRTVVAGQSASALLGAKWVDPRKPAELVSENRRPPPLIVVHSDTLLRDEVTDVEGIAVTTAARTAFDMGRRASRSLAVQRLDALANATGLTTTDVDAVIARHKGARGIRQLRRILSLVDGGSESPQESRTRLVLIDAGLPKPETQIRVCNEYGDFVGRVDMGWTEWLVAVEYDGSQHWTDPEQRRRDIDRLAELADCGWLIIRVSSDMLRHMEGTLVSRVVSALRSRGWAADPAPSVNLATADRRVA